MEGAIGIKELKALQSLLEPPKDDSDTEDDLPQSGANKLGPGDVGASNEREKEKAKEYAGPHAKLKLEKNEIWHPSEAGKTGSPDNEDPREVPEYEMKFKQSVSPEDIYLGMGFKTPGTASCEWLSVSVKLPQELREKVELSVKSDAIDIRSPRYRLHLPTPHPIDPNASSAKWYNETSTLEITLKLMRELDGINF